jgi:hypothetical protein
MLTLYLRSYRVDDPKDKQDFTMPLVTFFTVWNFRDVKFLWYRDFVSEVNDDRATDT